MGALAQTIEAVTSSPSGNAPLIPGILAQLDGDDRAAVERALDDFDPATRTYRVSAPVLARFLTEAGYPITASPIQRYRQKRGYARG